MAVVVVEGTKEGMLSANEKKGIMSQYDPTGMLLPDTDMMFPPETDSLTEAIKPPQQTAAFGLETTPTPAQFVSGAVRSDSSGRGHYEDISPLAWDRFAKHLELGAKEHGAWNYMLGMGMKRGMQSVLRHGAKYMYHKLTGIPALEDHLSAMLFGVVSLIHTEELIKLNLAPKELDDIPTLDSLKAAAANRSKSK